MKKCVILFSGGLDSSYTACTMLEKGYNVNLLHYDQGVLLTNKLYEIRADELRKAYPLKDINLHNINVSGIFRKMALVSIEQDILKYKHSLICLGCKLSMHLYTIIFCHENGISVVADGSSSRQNVYAEQSVAAINAIREIYAKYNIQYLNPIYDLGKKEVKYSLFDRGITIQPLEDTCLFSRTFSPSPDEAICAYIKDKEGVIHDVIKRRCFCEEN